MPTTKATNYPKETLEKLKQLYSELGTEGIEEIAKELNKPVKSVISKLVKEDLYIPKNKALARKTEGPSKKELFRELEQRGFDYIGFEGATKEALVRLLKLIKT